MIVEGTGGGGVPDALRGAYRDLTRWITEAAVYMASSQEIESVNEYMQRFKETGAIDYLILGMYEFSSIVKDGAPFDVKDKIKQKLGSTITLGDFRFEYSTAGNILYGFYGSAAGFDIETLHIGAGGAQTWDWIKSTLTIGDYDQNASLGPVNYYFDTVDDYYAVEFGYLLYEEYYLNDRRWYGCFSCLCCYYSKERQNEYYQV